MNGHPVLCPFFPSPLPPSTSPSSLPTLYLLLPYAVIPLIPSTSVSMQTCSLASSKAFYFFCPSLHLLTNNYPSFERVCLFVCFFVCCRSSEHHSAKISLVCNDTLAENETSFKYINTTNVPTNTYVSKI